MDKIWTAKQYEVGRKMKYIYIEKSNF